MEMWALAAGVTTATLAILLLLIRAIVILTDQQEDFVSLLEWSTAGVALVAAVLTFGALGWVAISVGLLFAVAIIAVAAFIIRLHRLRS
ncbi:MAG: hypothetical protein J0I43_10520 [Microbacterium sp.]|uniref:hypothetical protein n=1 Tax=Microbacterium sp. TaxID=51671 RepID=UPI001AC24290|nr:hypothetical protein [Microbacterium sp.]MBN9177788.1 hypothetical protein [Microbacterium sp.]